jgi:23S rRNA (uracil1939-C5)-methyltransferase
MTHATPAPNVTFEATVTSLAHGGAGVAHVDHRGERRAVFVGHVAPGDRVRLSADLSSRPARGALLEVLAPGEERVAAACPWVVKCGACDWLHLSSAAQTRWHVEHLRAALPAAWREIPVAVHASPRALGYRVRARVHVKCGRGGRVVAGMHAAKTRDPVEVEACAVMHPTLDRARNEVATFFEGATGRGEVQLALGRDALPVYEIEWAGDLPAAVFGRLERAVGEGRLAGARVTVADARRPANVGDPTPWMTGADGRPLRLASGGFGQANAEVNASLGKHVASLARESGAERAVELYAGAGNLSILLAAEVAELTCVETSREACNAARANLASRGARGKVVETDADAYEWKATTDLLVLDPPRTGARAVAERLAASRVAHAIYVSCDAPTLGRDLQRLEATYELRSLATFEMFPGTSHVEMVAHLTRAAHRRQAARKGSGVP